jgi:hypothetical protein
MNAAELKNIVIDIINSDDVHQSVDAVKKLSEFFNTIAADITFELSADNEKNIAGGQALSTYHAAACTNDYLRTCYFIKGIFRALTTLQTDFPNKTLNIIYAGCGPFATLLLPLLPLYESTLVDAVLLDINASSLQFVEKFISLLHLEEYYIKLVEADATKYQIPDGWDTDLFISETMHYALTAEPQVAITRNFIPQLLPHTVFIPTQIHINMVYTSFGREPFIKSSQDASQTTKDKPEPARLFIDRLFSIGKNAAEIITSTSIKSRFYPVPQNWETYPDLCIFTEVNIYEDLTLGTAESLITNPYCITSLYHLRAHSEFQLEYDYSETPKWALKFKN